MQAEACTQDMHVQGSGGTTGESIAGGQHMGKGCWTMKKPGLSLGGLLGFTGGIENEGLMGERPTPHLVIK